MKRRSPWLAFSACLLAGMGSFGANAKEAITSYFAPNKAYSVQIHCNAETDLFRAELIRTKKRKLLTSISEGSSRGDSLAVWSPNSRRVAIYCDQRRGGSITAYEVTGTSAVGLTMPEIDAPIEKDANKKVWRWSYIAEIPIRWQKNGDLILKCEGRFQDGNDSAKGVFFDFEYLVRVAFDKEHVGSVTSCQRKELKFVG